MNITLLQTDLHWQDPVANRAMLEEKIFTLPEPTDLIVLPEMFTTGFTMDARAVAEPMNLTTFRWLKQMAAQTNAVVMGSYVVQESGRFHNRLIWMEPDGQFATYDKRHLFRMAGEDKTYSAGTSRLIRTWRGWRVCPLVCYDLRFPALYRALAESGASFLAIPSAFTKKTGEAHWHTLLRARAIENGCFVFAAAQGGLHDNKRETFGHSLIIAPWGEILAEGGTEPGVIMADIDPAKVVTARQMVPSLQHGRRFTVSDPHTNPDYLHLVRGSA